MPLEEQVLTPDSPPFRIRHFVSTVRCNNFSKCWPFSRRILKRCILLGTKVDLPPFEPPCKAPTSSSPIKNENISFQDCHEKFVLCAASQESKQQSCADIDCEATSTGVSGGDLATLHNLPHSNDEAFPLVKQADAADGGQECQSRQGLLVRTSYQSLHNDSNAAVKTESSITSDIQVRIDVEPWVDASAKLSGANVSIESESLLARNHELTSKNSRLVHVTLAVELENNWTPEVDALTEPISLPHTDAIMSGHMFQSSKLVMPDDQCCNDEQGSNESSEVVIETPCRSPILRPMGRRQKVGKVKNTENYDGSTQVCPVCLKFSSTSNTALNAHIDHCLVPNGADLRQKKKRMRLKKMRSMTDIYASASACTLEDVE